MHCTTQPEVRSLEGFQTVASAHVLCLPTIICLSISIVSGQKLKVNPELSVALIEESIEVRIKLSISGSMEIRVQKFVTRQIVTRSG